MNSVTYIYVCVKYLSALTVFIYEYKSISYIIFLKKTVLWLCGIYLNIGTDNLQLHVSYIVGKLWQEYCFTVVIKWLLSCSIIDI